MLEELDTRRFLKLLKPHQAGMWAAFACTLLAALTEPAVPALMQPFLDNTVGQHGVGSRIPLWSIPLLIVALFTVRAVLSFVADYSIAWCMNGLVHDLRQKMFEKILEAQPALFKRQPASALNNTLNTETQNAVRWLVNSVQVLFKESLSLLALLGYLLYVNWRLTIVVLMLLPLVAWIMRKLGQRIHRFIRQQMEGSDALSYIVEENVLAHRVVRLHAAQGAQLQRFTEASNFLRGRIMRMTVAGAAVTPLTQIATAIALATVVSMAVQQSQVGNLSVGGFAAYLTAMLMAMPRAKALGDVYPGLKRGTAAIGRIFRLLDESAETSSGTHTAPRVQGNIELQGVSKSYENEEKPALNNLSLSIRAGETVALVGPSGSGKTTLASLLPRFIDADAGSVTLDGVPLSQWSLANLRSQFAMVSQDVVLFNDTVQANVAPGLAPDAARVEAALRGANLWEHVSAMPQGVKSVIGHNGSTLSGGQRQRLAIARALYKDAPVLILDEATSALDAESERQVQQALERLTANRTTLVIAHRLSTIQHADRIAVLVAGSIVEQGSYAELMRAGGAFSRLIAAQTGANFLLDNGAA